MTLGDDAKTYFLSASAYYVPAVLGLEGLWSSVANAHADVEMLTKNIRLLPNTECCERFLAFLHFARENPWARKVAWPLKLYFGALVCSINREGVVVLEECLGTD
jgi:hypothetical protein